MQYKKKKKKKIFFCWLFLVEALKKTADEVARRQKEFEAEATRKAEAKAVKTHESLKKQLADLKKQKEIADEAVKVADSQRKAAETARKLADRERELADEEKKFLEDQLKAKKDRSLYELLEKLNRQREELSDSDSDSGEPSSKRSKPDHEKCEFNPDGLKVIPATYNGMIIDDLVLFNQIRPGVIKSIAKGEFFNLNKMYTGTELTSTKVGNVTFTTESKDVPKQITQKSEIFFLLYQFGQIYLQIYPEKAVSFLEYLSFLTKMCDKFHAQALLDLDSAIRKEYVKHPQWNWDQVNGVIDRIYNFFARDPSNYKAGAFAGANVNPLASSASKSGGGGGKFSGKKQSKPFQQQNQQQLNHLQPQSVFIPNAQPSIQYPVQPFIPRPPPPQAFAPRPVLHPPMSQFNQPRKQFNNNNNRGGKGLTPDQKAQRAEQRNPNIRNERCTGWNFSAKGCDHKGRCLRMHCCYICGDFNHRVRDCPRASGGY